MASMRTSLAVTATLCLLSAAPATRAGNTYSFFLGNMAALSGGAVTVVGDDGASLWYNPAGLAVSRRDRIDLSGSAYTLRIHDYPRVLRGDIPELSDQDDPKLDLSSTELFSVPSAIAYVRHLSDDLSLAFGLFVPLRDEFSSTAELSLDVGLGHLDASVELEAASTVYTGIVGLGWRVGPRLRLGAALALYYQAIEVSQTLLFGYDARGPMDQSQGNGAFIQQGEGERFGFNVFVGAQWQLAPEWGLGLVVRTPLIQIYESVEQRLFLLDAAIAPDGSARVETTFLPMRQSGFEASVAFNFAFTLAFAWTPDDTSFLSLELDLKPGSKDDEIEREFVWNLRLGGVFPLSDTFRFGAGVFTDNSWEPDPTEAWVDQVDFYGLATGIYFETPIALRDNDASSLIFTSTIGLRYALGLGTTLRARATPFGIDTDPGRVAIDLTFHELGIHVGSGLRF